MGLSNLDRLNDELANINNQISTIEAARNGTIVIPRDLTVNMDGYTGETRTTNEDIQLARLELDRETTLIDIAIENNLIRQELELEEEELALANEESELPASPADESLETEDLGLPDPPSYESLETEDLGLPDPPSYESLETEDLGLPDPPSYESVLAEIENENREKILNDLDEAYMFSASEEEAENSDEEEESVSNEDESSRSVSPTLSEGP